MRKLLSISLSVILIGILLIGVQDLPDFGDINNPANNYVSNRYIEKGVEETGAQNIVTGIILDYRAFDTFGEATVLFTGVVAVIIALKKNDN